MSVLVFLLSALALFLLGSRYYGGYIARFLGVDRANPTPAVQLNDGKDYVPTRTPVLFAHHYSAIAGAGPILGPTMAALYGFLPAWLWIVVGGIFFGAVHDFTSLFVSMREKGRSMAEIARKSMGNAGFSLFIFFTIVMIVLVTSAFLTATATALTSQWPLAKLGLSADQTLLKTHTAPDGTVVGSIGGIASMSVVIITLFAPLLGYLLYKRGIRISVAYVLAFAIAVGSVVVGIMAPIRVPAEVWMIIISVYVFFAAGAPVWVILQPRDFINVQLLYGGIALMVVSLLIGGAANGLSIHIPSFNFQEGMQQLGLVWPMLFITIACGAISGFHSIVASGTTAKQISNESHARRIGYDGMLLESVLAVCVILALGSSLVFTDYKAIVWPDMPGVRSNPILAFSLAMGHLLQGSLYIPMAFGTIFGILLVEGFVITTLDAAVRLNRYLFEELWSILFERPPALLKQYWFNSGLSVLLMLGLAYTNAFSALWPIFGTGNQLLAALSLIAVSFWLLKRGKRPLFTMIPAAFMIVTTMTSLVILLNKYLQKGNFILVGAALLLLVLSVGVVLVAVQTYRRLGTSTKAAPGMGLEPACPAGRPAGSSPVDKTFSC